MKKNYSVIISLALLAFVAFTGFECASTELTSAKLYIQQKNYDKAIEALEKEVAKNPKSDEGYYLMGYLYGERENSDKMIDAFEKSLGISKKFEKDIKTARKAYWANAFNKGVGFFNKATKATNDDSAKVYFDKTIFYFNQAIKAEPDSADTYKNLAFVYLNISDYDAAINPLKKLVELRKDIDGYRYLGEIYYNKGANLMNKYATSKNTADSVNAMVFYNEGIKVLEEGRKLYSTDSDILLTLSNSYIAANKIEVAIDAFKSGVEQEPNNKSYRYNYGVLLLGANNFPAAEEQFKAAINLDPEYMNAVYNLAVTYIKWGAKLQKDADAAGKEDPNIKEKYRLALPLLERYLSSKNDDASVWELIGKVYSVLSMKSEAENAFKKADELRK